MIITREQAQSYSGGGNRPFKLTDNETARVRFLYNKLEDIEYLAVHSLRENGRFATVDCSRLQTDPVEQCKWCAQGSQAVARVVIPIFNLQTNKIEYWVRSKTWIDGTVIPALEQVPVDKPISGEIFLVRRTKTGSLPTDVSYSVQPELGSQNDGQLKTAFGEIKDPYQCGAIQPNDYTFPVAQTQNQPQGNMAPNNFQSTRRTNDVF